ncbi:hypothetical protein ISR94_03620 [Candidatus Microgenomates bacterium]|nr:hypothetical protein [Candidatus Microgenomates bacterium]
MKNKLVISLLAILALVLGIFAYLLSTNSLVSNNSYKTELENIEVVSESDQVEDIETDLQNTELDNIDSEMNDIELELDSAINVL